MPYLDHTVTAYHGTRQDRGEIALREQVLHPTRNSYDWLGHGVYFWENYSRAHQWAEEKYGGQGVVIRTRVLLGHCVDLMDTNWAPVVKQASDRVTKRYAKQGEMLPQNRGGYRPLDCLVMNELFDMLEADTARAAFLEGEPIYPTSILVGLAHIQLVVRNPKAIISPLEFD